MIRRAQFHRVLALVFGVVAAIPVIVLGVVLHAYLAEQISAEITRNNMLLATSVRREINALFQQPVSLLGEIGDRIDRHRQNDGLQPYDALLIDTVVKSNLGFEAVYLLNHRGKIIAAGFQEDLVSGRNEVVGLSMAGQEYFQVVKETGDTYWSNVSSSMRSGEPLLTVSRPSGDGVIVGTLNLARLDRIVADMGAARGVEVSVTDKTGVLIISRHHWRDVQGVNLGGLVVVERGMAGEEGTYEYTDMDVEKLGSVVRVANTGWLVIVSQDMAQAFAPLRLLEFIAFAAVLLSLALATMAAIVLSRRLTKPLSRFAADVRRISTGEYGFSLEVSGYAEIDELAADFETMSENLRRRETEIRESETKLRAVIDSSPAGIFLKDLDGRYLLANKEYAGRSGMTVDEVIGKTVEEIQDETIVGKATETDREVIETGRICEFELHRVDPAGRARDFMVTKFPIKNSEGMVTGIGAVSTDVTERKQAETELQKIAERVSSVTGVDFFKLLVAELAELVDVDVALVGRLVPGHHARIETIAVFANGTAAEPITYDLPGSPCENVVGKQPCVYKSGVQQLFPGDELLAEINANGYVGAPLFDSQGLQLGLIAIMDSEPIQRVERCLATLRIFAARTAVEMERLRAEEELRQSEFHYHLLFDGIGSGVAIHEIICDADGEPIDYRFLDANPAFERLTGSRRKDIVGKTVLEVWPDTEQYWIETYGRVALTGEPAFFENYAQELDKYFDVVAFSPTHGQFAVTFTDVTERRRAEDALRSSEEDLRGILDNMIDTFFRTDIEGTILILSPSFERLFGISILDAVGQNVSSFLVDPAGRHSLTAAMEQNDGRVSGFELRARRSTGEEFWLSITARQVLDESGQAVGIEGIIRDISQRKETEDALRRSQRMEAIGQLTGGVAHDFNNLLGVVIGNLDFLKEILDVEEIAEKRIAGALRAAWRGADLTKKLLAFARRDPGTPVSIDLNRVVESMRAMLARTLTEKIDVHAELSEGLWLTEIDEGDFEDAILNLAINARDAMLEGGRLNVRTANVVLSGADTGRYPDAALGEYVEISVADNGSGMTPEVRERVFEPFFTTKVTGEGTGLGLSMVYGFVRRAKGSVYIETAPGAGTDVRLLLPRTVSIAEAAEAQSQSINNIRGGHETILVVDDETELRRLVEEYLSRLGYRTLGAENARDALGALKSGQDIDLLFSDIVMPGGMSGEVLAEQAIQMRPGIKVLLTTGFTHGMVRDGKATTLGAEVLPKPFRRDELAKRIRTMLDG